MSKSQKKIERFLLAIFTFFVICGVVTQVAETLGEHSEREEQREEHSPAQVDIFVVDQQRGDLNHRANQEYDETKWRWEEENDALERDDIRPAMLTGSRSWAN